MYRVRLERRYARLRKELEKLMVKMRNLSPRGERRWNRVEAELCEVERKLLKLSLVLA